MVGTDDARSDEALLSAIAGGDEQALTAFYRRHAAAVRAFAQRRLGEPADAAEVLNEAMLEVWRKAATFAGQSRPRTWLLGIANHKILDKLRRRGTPTAELDESLPDPEADRGLGEIEAQQRAGLVQQCLETLGDLHRQVVHLTFYQELSYPEIAEVLGCPLGTVKTRMFHARKALERCVRGLLGGAA